MTIKNKIDLIFKHYGEDSFTNVLSKIEVLHKELKFLQNLLDTWMVDPNTKEYGDSKEIILLINLLYNLTFNKNENKDI